MAERNTGERRFGSNGTTAELNSVRNHNLTVRVEEAKLQDIAGLSLFWDGNCDSPGSAGCDMRMNSLLLATGRPFNIQFRKICKFVTIIHSHYSGVFWLPIRQISLLQVHRGHEHLDVPKLRLLTAPTVNHSPGRIADNSATGHVIDTIEQVFRPAKAAAAIFRITPGNQKYVIHPSPDHAALHVLARLDGVPNVY